MKKLQKKRYRRNPKMNETVGGHLYVHVAACPAPRCKKENAKVEYFEVESEEEEQKRLDEEWLNTPG